jgi:hypothetical protein
MSTTDYDPTSIIGTGISTLDTSLGGVAPLAVGAAALLAALGIGWRLVRKYVKP